MTLALLWDDFGVTLGCRYRQAAAVSPLLTVAAAALPPPPERTFDEGLEQFCPKGALFARTVPKHRGNDRTRRSYTPSQQRQHCRT